MDRSFFAWGPVARIGDNRIMDRTSWPSALLAGLIVFACLAVLVERQYRLESQRASESARASVLQKAALTRARVERELSSTLYITSGLVGYVTAYDDLLEAERVTTALATLYRHGEHIRNVAMAPENVLRFIYPLEGNREAIGLDYQHNPRQWPAVERAMRERRTVLDGPIELVQGGRGLISRTPVFLEREGYWGVLSMVIDTDSLLAAAGFFAEGNGVDYALRWLQPDARRGGAIAGPQQLFRRSPVLLEISVPGGAWQLGAVPADGWNDPASGNLQLYRFIGLAVALVVAVLLSIVVRERQMIAKMALQDPLTGLANRRRFGRWLRRELDRAHAAERSFALIYIDLDGFKEVNDQGGHALGDRVLRKLAGRMVGVLRDGERIARLGGDEFAVILPRIAEADRAARRGQAIRDAIRAPFRDLELPVPLDASIGVAVYPDDGRLPDDLLRAADREMYAAKREAPAS
ncbi:MAG: diguanylate cyclase domain-containing protein [Candidatus Wenzhouxiangella sp. M2_3B_020]